MSVKSQNNIEIHTENGHKTKNTDDLEDVTGTVF